MYNTQSTHPTAHTNPFARFGGACGGPQSRRSMPPWMRKAAGEMGHRPPVNIEETDAAFSLSLYAAGGTKDAFSIAVKDDVLSIAYKAPETTDAKSYTHREFSPASFERRFQLGAKVLAENISATYTDGVLKVTLPKNPETSKPTQNVTVS